MWWKELSFKKLGKNCFLLSLIFINLNLSYFFSSVI